MIPQRMCSIKDYRFGYFKLVTNNTEQPTVSQTDQNWQIHLNDGAAASTSKTGVPPLTTPRKIEDKKKHAKLLEINF
jgi:hypothetical protein